MKIANIEDILREDASINTDFMNDMVQYEGLDFRMSACGDRLILQIAVPLMHNTTIKILNLDYCSIRTKGMEAIAGLLRFNKTIEKITLGSITATNLNTISNSASDKFCKTLTDSLSQNETLLELNLDNLKITSENSLYIAAILKLNSSITSLSIQGNDIKASGAFAIFQALEDNDSLTSLNISSNGINYLEYHTENEVTYKIEEYIRKALKNNFTLTSCDFATTSSYSQYENLDILPDRMLHNLNIAIEQNATIYNNDFCQNLAYHLDISLGLAYKYFKVLGALEVPAE